MIYNNSFFPFQAQSYLSSKPMKKPKSMDFGPSPYIVDIHQKAKENENFRTAIWTGTHLQMTVMSIPVGEDIGVEVHDNLDQFIRIEDGKGLVKMGSSASYLPISQTINKDYGFFVPAGTWHNLINTGMKPLKLYSIYAPPKHPKGTVHPTKADAEKAE